MRVARAVLGLALLAMAAAFLWALFAPRRKVEEAPAAAYVAPEPAADEEVSVAEATPLPVRSG